MNHPNQHDGSGGQFAKKHILHTCQTIEPDIESGQYILTVPEAAPELIVPWVFAQMGEAVPLSPKELVEEVRRQERSLGKAIGSDCTAP